MKPYNPASRAHSEREKERREEEIAFGATNTKSDTRPRFGPIIRLHFGQPGVLDASGTAAGRIYGALRHE